ncbi:unnamed protein product [Meloidogyne enterolobii]|uniref:Uncharacterized protein n=2 Tax=Meloidogyne enterolobii TaxID=390850 RepID=A0ACB1B0U3_MELEN
MLRTFGRCRPMKRIIQITTRRRVKMELNLPGSIVGGSGSLVENAIVSVLSVMVLSSACLSMLKDNSSGQSSDGRTIHSGPFHQRVDCCSSIGVEPRVAMSAEFWSVLTK